MADPNASFVVVSTTRSDIAADLNHRLETSGCQVRLSPSDELLTDEVCAAYAQGKPVDWDNPSAGYMHEENVIKALTSIGLA